MANHDATRADSNDRLTRRRCLALAALGATGLAGCSSGGGGDGGDGDPSGADTNAGGDGLTGATDPFDSVEVGPQFLTAEVASSAVDEGAEVVALVGDGETVVEADIERGTAEVGLSVVGDCGSCAEFDVRVPDGEYTLEARALPENDAAEPTTVGSRAVTVDRTAEITAVEDEGGDVAVTVENTGDLLIRVRGVRREPTDPDALDAPADWYTETESDSFAGIERTDSPDHDFSKTENRPVLEMIVAPGSDGVFAFSGETLYRSEGMTSEDACTGQSVGLRFEVLGQRGTESVNETPTADSPVRAAATGELTFGGEVTGESEDGFACSTVTVENLSDAEP